MISVTAMDCPNRRTVSVAGSVLVKDGFVYVLAGRSAHVDGGIYFTKLDALTGEAACVVRVPEDRLYRVRIGPVRGRSAAMRVQSAVSAAALPTPLILP